MFRRFPLFDEKKDDATVGGGAAVTLDEVKQLIEQAFAPIVSKLDSLGKKPEPKPEPKPEVKPEPKPEKKDQKGEELPPAARALIEELTGKVSQLTSGLAEVTDKAANAEKRAEDESRKSALASALSGFVFNNDHAQSMAVNELFPKIQRSQIDQSLVIDGLPLSAAVKKAFEPGSALLYLLRPKSGGGMGVENNGSGQGAKQIKISDIQKMSAEDRRALAEQIGRRSANQRPM